MQKLDAQSHRRTPWKNGGGTTREIACSPLGASFDAFDWRVSLATVSSPGPFSRFEGVDRSLAVVRGKGLALAIAGRSAVVLDRDTPPFSFPGELEITGSLWEGAIDDVNVMTRRGRCRHLLTRLHLDGPTTVPVLGRRALLIVVLGAASARSGDRAQTLSVHDALSCDASTTPTIELSPEPEAELMVVDLWDVGG